MNFHYNAETGEADYFDATGTCLFSMSELSFKDANTINDAIRVMEKKAYDRGAAEAIKRIKTALHGMEEQISLDEEDDDSAPPPKRSKEQRHRA